MHLFEKYQRFITSSQIQKILMITKFSCILIWISILTVTAEVYSQSIKFSVEYRDVSLETVLSKIESQSEFSFFYTDQVDLSRKISIRIKDGNISELLDAIFSGTDIGYKIRDKLIIIHAKEKEIRTIKQTGIKITGTVSENFGALPGVNVIVRGSTVGTTTDANGEFSITVPSDTSVLQFRFIGYQQQEIVVGNRRIIAVTMQEATTDISEVTIVAFGKQKTESMLASVASINPQELKVPSSNLTTAMAGRIAGIISYQRSGEPGVDNADFFIRGVTTFGYKKDPLILIDGVELTSDDLARLQVDDIASFSIMKDATATALYGARGANGVILVTTKEGREGKTQVSIRFENSFSSPTKSVKLADPITYMKMNNEAVKTRDVLGALPHSMQKIAYTEAGMNPYVYPAVDWYNMLFDESTSNQRVNLNISGGGPVARYYIAGTYNRDNGNLKADKRNNFNNNININKYVLRANVNVNVTKTTEAIVKLHATMDDYSGPIDGGATIYEKVMQTSPVHYPAYFKPDDHYQYAEYILFGNYGTGNYINPYADMVKGYRDTKQSLMLAQFEIRQKLDFITEGLNARAMFNTTRRSVYGIRRAYSPYYFQIGSYDSTQDQYTLFPLNGNSGTDFLTTAEDKKNVITTTYFESALNYDRTFAEKHDVSGLLVFIMRDELSSVDNNNLQKSLPARNMGLSGRFTYAYGTRYFVEFNFGYNGSERFAKNERYGFFPSAGLGWMVSNETFWEESLKNVISKLKLKGTYGLVGNDAIGDVNSRFYYLSEVNLSSSNYAYTWGQMFNETKNGVVINRYANPTISWETSRKTNLGLELGLFNQLELQADIYRDYRYNILMPRESIPGTMGLQTDIQANIGEAVSKGIDFSLDYNWAVNTDLWISVRANYTYATSEYKVYEEPDYSDTPWRSQVGHPIGQQWGYVAERFFVDDAEVRNSPIQTFSEYKGGDLKYVDINGDSQITAMDQVPIGYPTTPEIVYGFGFSAGYKGFDLSCFFQGLARETFWIDTKATAPFINTGDFSGYIGQNQVLKAYADSYWSEENRNLYALWPRLSTIQVTNNTQRNTWFMRDGSFLRLKTLEFGYTFPEKWTQKLRMTSGRLYYSGTNLWCFSKFKLWDPEMAGNGLGYPVQRVHNIGINLSF
jgi:TonB-linked SusC/RagA family outer membrane protein